MYITNSNYQLSKQPAFGNFYAVKGSKHEINNVRKIIRNKTNKYFILKINKTNKKSVLYLLSGKHEKTFFELAKQHIFVELKHNLEKFMQEKPKQFKIKDIIKKFTKKD